MVAHAQVSATEPNRGGALDLKSIDLDFAKSHLKTPDGFEINLFASEQDFPIDNAVSMTFDAKGRLWVATMPTYPQYLPGEPPHDKLVVLEDTNGDGKADKHTVFADGLHLPTGFELGDGGAYVAAQPNLLFLKDTDGDGKADVRKTILYGFGTEDSHHAISAFTWDPGGALYFQEGTFHHTQVETPWGPVRVENAAVFRFVPKKYRLEVFVSYGFANPWGHIFDRWGQNFVADASGGSNYYGTAFSGRIDHPQKHPRMNEFTSTKVRPTAGCEIVASRNFPDEMQGNFLLNNCIGFQGVKNHRMIEEGSGFTTKEEEPLLISSDINFRPVDIQFGPDGALYLCDWFNPLIGHMQYSLRDERRDHKHGRIWRIHNTKKPLVEPVKIADRPVPELLDLLKTYEDRDRYRARREIRKHESKDVVAAVDQWIGGLDKSDPQYEHNLLEGLWVYQGANHCEPDHLRRMLRSPDPKARAAATRVLCYQRDKMPDALELLREQANDDFPRVRLEAVRACSFFENAEAAEVALEVLKHPTDYYIDYTLKETMKQLERWWRPAIAEGKPFASDNQAGVIYVLGSISTAELLNAKRTAPVYIALLSRAGVRDEYRQEALRGLAKIKGTNRLTELLDAIDYVDGAKDARPSVMYDLAHLLTGFRPERLTSERPRLEKMSRESKRSTARQIGYVAMVAADQSIDRVWEAASSNVSSLRDLLDAAQIIPDPKLRAALYPHVKPLMTGLPDGLAERIKADAGTRGRFIRIELTGPKRVLTLAEVQVYSDGVNIAPQGTARQKSTGHGGEAKRAIDGNTSGKYTDGGQTHTEENTRNPWWQLDFGTERPIEAIVVWNRTEQGGVFKGRLDGFDVKVLDASRNVVWESVDNRAPVVNTRFELEADPKGVVRRAAINAATFIPGHEEEVFKTLAGFVESGDERHASVRALHAIPTYKWPKTQVPGLVDSIVKYAQNVPAKDRATPAVRDALQLGNDLAALLPAERAKEVRAAIGDLGVRIVLLRAVPHKMRYDKREIAVQAGKPVEIAFDNTDIMPHNLLITTPGAMIEVAQMAERMATQPDAFALGFVPDTPKVLWHTKLLQSRQRENITFVAPTEPGEYPYVCTFPGHFRTMYGVMHVVEDLETWLVENPIEEPVDIGEVRPFVKDWKLADLLPELPELERGRDYENGKKMFRAASCIACHRMNEIGGLVGPDLAKWDKKLTRKDMLTELVEPSKRINEKFKTWVIVDENGLQHTGLILSEDDKLIRLMPNPLGMEKCEPVVLLKDQIEFKKESKISLMPEGLLKTLSREEILDLLAYVEARGDRKHTLFTKE